MSKKKTFDYPFSIRHLTDEEGGGYLIEYPDLPGCMSDGETEFEAIQNGKGAVEAWIDAATSMGREVPMPGDFEHLSGKWLQRVPKSIHLRLVTKAKQEGVSLNTLVITLLSESLGELSTRAPKEKEHKRRPRSG